MRARALWLLVPLGCAAVGCGDDRSTTSAPATAVSPPTTGATATAPSGATGAGPTERGGRPARTAAPASARASAGTDEQRIRKVVREALTTADPGACTRLFTLPAVQQTTMLRGAAALRECRANADQVAARTVSIERVSVRGGGAEVDVRPAGGHAPFKAATFTLVKVGGKRWKINRLKGATLDRARFERVLGDELGDAPGGELLPGATRAATAACVVRELEPVGDAVIVKSVYVTPRAAFLFVPAITCGIREGLKGRGLPQRTIDCVVDGVRDELTSGALSTYLASSAGYQALSASGLLNPAVAQVAARCGGAALGAAPG